MIAKLYFILIVTIGMLFYLMIIQTVKHPHFSHTDPTAEQRSRIHKAQSKYGDYQIERRGYGEGYFIMVLPNGERKL